MVRVMGLVTLGADDLEPARRIPRSVTAYTAALAVVAILATALAASDQGRLHWAGAAGLFLTLVVAGTLRLRFQYGRDVEALDVFDAVVAPCLFALPAPVAVAAVAAAKFASQRWNHVEPLKARFNTAQWAAAASVGALVFHLGGGASEPTPRNLALLAAAMLAVSVVNHLAVVGVLRLTGRGSIRQILTDLSPVMLPGWVVGGLVNLAFGFIFVATWSAIPWFTPLFLVPLGLLHWANRNYAEARADRARLAGLQQATRALQEPVDPRTALPPFLIELRPAFEAGVCALILDGGDGVATVHRVDCDGYTAQPFTDTVRSAAWATASARFTRATRVETGSEEAEGILRLVSDEWSNALLAPVRSEEAVLGFLIVHDRLGLHGFAEGELAVLDVLASEVSSALDKGTLLDTILEDRRHLSEIVNNTSDGIATLSAAGQVLTWNAGFEHLSGFSHRDVAGGGEADLLTARSVRGRPVPLRGWADGTTLPAELEITTAEGEARWLSCSYSHVADSTGRPERLILIARDVTEGRLLQQAQDELRETETRLRSLRESEEHVAALLRNASDVVVVVNSDGVVTYCGQGQPSRGQLVTPELHQRWVDVVHPDDRTTVEEALRAEAGDPGTNTTIEYRLAAAGGGWRLVETAVTNLLGVPPVEGIVLNTKDVTDRRQAEALLASETEILGLIAREEALEEILRRVLASLEAQRPGVRAIVALLQEGRPQVVGGADVGPLDLAVVAEQVAARGAAVTANSAARRENVFIGGMPEWTLHELVGSDGTSLGFICLDRPLDPLGHRLVLLFAGLVVVAVERHRCRADLTHRATHDTLTGLPNRSVFLDRLTMALARSSRSGAWVGVLYCDIDGFKAINDNLGHDVGDQLLVAFGDRLLSSVRSGDTAARLGGDEFIVLCEGLNHPSEAATVAENLRQTLSRPFSAGGREVVVPPSIGVAVAGGGGEPCELIERADAAMYRAKRKGGNRWELTESVTQVR